jgi:crossover junction endodeoxyribonuclease RusA
MVLHRHRRAAKNDARVACMGERILRGRVPASGLRFEFFPPDRRRRDIDGCIGALKAAIDGIAEALGIDDSRLAMKFPERFGEPVKRGLIRVTIEIPAT